MGSSVGRSHLPHCWDLPEGCAGMLGTKPGGRAAPPFQTSPSNDSATGALTCWTECVTVFRGLRRCLGAGDAGQSEDQKVGDKGREIQTPRFQRCSLVGGAMGTGGMAAQRGGELPVVPEFIQRLGGHQEVTRRCWRSPGGATGLGHR